jgi:hypothetical protein
VERPAHAIKDAAGKVTGDKELQTEGKNWTKQRALLTTQQAM